MFTMTKATKARRPRRQFTDEFKVGAVRLVLHEGRPVGRVARNLDLTDSALRTWVERARSNRTHGKTGLTSVEREELRRRRKENRRLSVGSRTPPGAFSGLVKVSTKPKQDQSASP